MGRLARVVAVDVPHHLTQRGNRHWRAGLTVRGVDCGAVDVGCHRTCVVRGTSPTAEAGWRSRYFSRHQAQRDRPVLVGAGSLRRQHYRGCTRRSPRGDGGGHGRTCLTPSWLSPPSCLSPGCLGLASAPCELEVASTFGGFG